MYLSHFYIPVNTPLGGWRGAATQTFAPGGKYLAPQLPIGYHRCTVNASYPSPCDRCPLSLAQPVNNQYNHHARDGWKAELT